MRAHFFEISGIHCVFFPDTLQYFKINSFAEAILRDMVKQRNTQEEICKRHSISTEEYKMLYNMLTSAEIEAIKKNTVKENKLNRLVLNISNNCNLNCIYCYAKGGSYLSKAGLMSSVILRNTLDLFFSQFDIENIQLFGGEPLLNPSAIEDVCHFVDGLEEKRRPIISIVTNGTIVSEEMLTLIKRYDIRVTVSIDGPPHINDCLRISKDGSKSTAIVENNIRRISERTGSPVYIEATYTKQHQKQHIDISDLVKYFSDSFGTENIHIVPVVDENLAVDDEDIIQSIDKVFENFKGGYPLPTLVTKVLLALKYKKKPPHICNAGWGTLAVAADGFVYPCFMFADREGFVMGHVTDKYLFERNEYKDWYHKLASYNKFETAECKDCFANTICGGCLGQNDLDTGSIFISSEKNCIRQKAVIEHVLVELIRIKKYS